MLARQALYHFSHFASPGVPFLTVTITMAPIREAESLFSYPLIPFTNMMMYRFLALVLSV
jgi:hypothetical protein